MQPVGKDFDNCIQDMDNEIIRIATLLQEAYEGEPWFGRPAKALLSEVNSEMAFEQINGQHSIIQLVQHMINWRRFTISRMEATNSKLHHFEQHDWQPNPSPDEQLWQQTVAQLDDTQEKLLTIIKKLPEIFLNTIVPERNYTFYKLLHGIIQHDIYHLGQIAYIVKVLRN